MDYRERSYYGNHIKQDFANKTIIIDGKSFPAKWTICPSCNGDGTYVNPSIDINGLSQECLEDEDFMEDYRSGVYDITCKSCNGSGKILVASSEEGQDIVDAYIQGEYEINSIYEAERQFGA